jgi:hypothetical protein
MAQIVSLVRAPWCFSDVAGFRRARLIAVVTSGLVGSLTFLPSLLTTVRALRAARVDQVPISPCVRRDVCQLLY